MRPPPGHDGPIRARARDRREHPGGGAEMAPQDAKRATSGPAVPRPPGRQRVGSRAPDGRHVRPVGLPPAERLCAHGARPTPGSVTRSPGTSRTDLFGTPGATRTGAATRTKGDRSRPLRPPRRDGGATSGTPQVECRAGRRKRSARGGISGSPGPPVLGGQRDSSRPRPSTPFWGVAGTRPDPD
jgi:hypothetical protein